MCCDEVFIHEDSLSLIEKEMPCDEKLIDLAEFFRLFGDSTRIKIIFALSKSELCVCDLAAALGMSSSAISHQLRLLKARKLVKNRREGKSVFYSLADEHVKTIVNQGMEHIAEN
ncbi:MAG: ArsR/SmtB family transcription factor [Candidatus Scatomorpha sp.]